MAGEWPTVSVSELEANSILLVQDGNHGEYRPRSDEFVLSGVAFIRAADMADGRVLFESAAKINDVAFNRITKGIGQPGDVLLSHKGTVGKVAIAQMDCPAFVCSPQTTFWRTLDESTLDRSYLYVYLRGRHFHDQLATRSAETDMAPYVSLTSQRGLSILMPPVGVQRAIGRVVQSIDDKIELNRRMNATLEGISRAIFKSWFVDFDPVRQKAAGKQPFGMDAQTAALFPDSFEDSEIGEVPKGWEVGPLSRFFEIGLGGAWGDEGPSEKSSQAVRCLRGIDCHDLAEGLLPEVPSRWISPKQCNDRLLTDGTILVEGSGSFCGRSLCWRPEYESLIAPPVVYSNFCKRLSPRCTPSQSHLVWRQMRSAYTNGELSAFRVGTAFPNFDMQGALDNFCIVAPPDALAQRYTTVARQSQRLDLIRQSKTLAALRDTLLPKLLSGEVRVPEAEEAVEEAVR